jgi:hypothetical protein
MEIQPPQILKSPESFERGMLKDYFVEASRKYERFLKLASIG